jgi:acetyl esterase/lipase
MRLARLLSFALALVVNFSVTVRAADEVSLWPHGAPGSEGQTAPEVAEKTDAVRLSSVHKPSLTVFLPAKEKATGAAVIVMPGGGHRFLSIENEGTKCAEWLAEHGVAGLVLKYRLSREPNSPYKLEHSMADAERAVRVAKAKAKEWNIDPDRIGVLGFSAGGELAAHVGTKFEPNKPDASDQVEQQTSRPAFQALIYAQIPKDVPDELAKDTPPGFVVVAADDKPKVGQDSDFFRKLNAAGIPAELHVFAQGGHGFGMRDRPLPISAWPTRFYEWLDNQGFLKPLPAKANKTSAHDPKSTPPVADKAVAAAPIAKAATKPADEANAAAQADLDRTFKDVVHPFLAAYCTNCHSAEKPKAQFDLAPYANLDDVVKGYPHWLLVLEKLNAKEMPPEEAKKQPTVNEVKRVVAWVEAVRQNETRKNAGDPGIVLARRLSNSEYNYTIRDLTGVDIRPTREFPIDPANPMGFDNTGESLSMSPALLNKYLQAAREVASHLVFKPHDFAFAPHPMLAETDRDKYCVQQIINFYHAQDIDYADYFNAAWKFKHRAALRQPNATLVEVAAQNGVSAKYLNTVWTFLEEKTDVGPGAKLQAMWNDLPTPTGNHPELAKDGSRAMRDYVVQVRKKVEPRFTNLAAGRVSAGSQIMLMWRNRMYATHRMMFDPRAMQVAGEASKPADEAANEPGTESEFGPCRTQAIKNKPGDPDLAVPTGEREKYEAAFAKFCAMFPDNFYIQERGRNYFDTTKDKGRYLSAGFHNLMGYFRDDQPLYELVLDEKQQKQLDEMWQELDYIANATARTYVQWYLSESGEARPNAKGATAGDGQTETKDITSEASIERVLKSYRERAEGANQAGLKAVEEHFKWVNDTLRWTEKAKQECEPHHLDALLDFASRAYRRALTEAEKKDLVNFYRDIRQKDGLDHESAMRDCVVSVLMSPDFCYRIDLVESGPDVQPLSDDDLASRLSYFLWSSMPDEKLVERAAAGELRKPEVLAAEARRMLKDSRVRGLAVEFGGNWLDFRRFEELNTVDRNRFPSFDNDLRQAMFEEPVRFMLDVFQNNRSIVDFLNANHTFVNPVLAKHYGIDGIRGDANTWTRVDNADRYGRGGLLPMAAFLTKNAPGLRTSPVKRGYWVVKNVLGERIPPPPAMVPELPRDEAKIELPLRQLLAQHRENAACSTCHSRFDSLGLVFEGYGPIGELRTVDLAGHKIDAGATFPNGDEGVGFDGVRKYIREKRQNDFVENLCRKLLAYSLNRSLMLSDELTVQQLRENLAKNDYKFETLIEGIVTSPQFLNKRGREDVAAK